MTGYFDYGYFDYGYFNSLFFDTQQETTTDDYAGHITRGAARSYAVITKAKTLSVTELITKAGS